MIASPQDNFHRVLKQNLEPLVHEALNKGIFPGAALGISYGSQPSRKNFAHVYGHAATVPKTIPLQISTVFDLASLTKPLATTLALLVLLREEKIALDDTLPQLLEQSVPVDKQTITLFDLLHHSSGLVDWQPYFEKMRNLPENERKNFLQQAILAEPLTYEPGEKSVYSDLGFMLLGWIVEIKAQTSLDVFASEKVYAPLGLDGRLFFNRLGRMKGDNYAATEHCPWRRKVLQGEVHDDNAYCLGGVAGHAGLFGDITSVMKLLELLFDTWQMRQTLPNIDSDELRYFFTRPGPETASTWALGFDTPSPKKSSSGRYFSSKSVGHLGYTGTSFWMDPEKNLIVCLLTNRVHPSRENTEIKEFRPLLHDTVVEALGIV